jgi:hypothetical protein
MMMTTTATATMMTKTMMMTTIMIRTATETTMTSMATSPMMRMRMKMTTTIVNIAVIVVAASAPIEVRGILCVELLHESQNALPDVRDEYPLTFDASCAVMLALISSSREGEDGALPSQYLHLQLLLLFPEDIFALCTLGSLNDPDATTSPPPSDILYSTVAW